MKGKKQFAAALSVLCVFGALVACDSSSSKSDTADNGIEGNWILESNNSVQKSVVSGPSAGETATANVGKLYVSFTGNAAVVNYMDPAASYVATVGYGEYSLTSASAAGVKVSDFFSGKGIDATATSAITGSDGTFTHTFAKSDNEAGVMVSEDGKWKLVKATTADEVSAPKGRNGIWKISTVQNASEPSRSVSGESAHETAVEEEDGFYVWFNGDAFDLHQLGQGAAQDSGVKFGDITLVSSDTSAFTGNSMLPASADVQADILKMGLLAGNFKDQGNGVLSNGLVKLVKVN